MEVKIYEQDWKNGKNLESTKIHTVCGEDHIRNLMLNTEQLRPQQGPNAYSQTLLLIYSRDHNGNLQYEENFKKFIDESVVVPNVIYKDPLPAEVYSPKKENNKHRKSTISKIVGYRQVNDYYQIFALTPEEEAYIAKLTEMFETQPSLVRKWTTSDLLSFMLHSKLSSSIFPKQNTKMQAGGAAVQFQQIIDVFIDLKLKGDDFFNFTNEAEVLKVLGDPVRPLGVRKNLMRLVRKLRTLEEKIEKKRQDEEQRKQRVAEIEKARKNKELNFQVIDIPSLEDQKEKVQTSKSQQNQANTGVFSKLANISGVQDVVSGAMSGLSAYMGWTQVENMQNERIQNEIIRERGVSEIDIDRIPIALEHPLAGSGPTLSEHLREYYAPGHGDEIVSASVHESRVDPKNQMAYPVDLPDEIQISEN